MSLIILKEEIGVKYISSRTPSSNKVLVLEFIINKDDCSFRFYIKDTNFKNLEYITPDGVLDEGSRKIFKEAFTRLTDELKEVHNIKHFTFTTSAQLLSESEFFRILKILESMEKDDTLKEIDINAADSDSYLQIKNDLVNYKFRDNKKNPYTEGSCSIDDFIKGNFVELFSSKVFAETFLHTIFITEGEKKLFIQNKNILNICGREASEARARLFVRELNKLEYPISLSNGVYTVTIP